jgi:hypothetical protein
MEWLTWAVVWVAFAAWAALVGVGGLWVFSLAQQAAALAPSTLESVAGVILYREADRRTEATAQEGLQLFDGDELAASFGSSATLRVFDGSLLQIFPNARLRVTATRIGRFNPSTTQASFALVAGAVRLSVPESSSRAHRLTVTTPYGAAAFLPGEYTLRVEPDAARISVVGGRVLAGTVGEVVEVAAGQKIRFLADGSPPQVVDRMEDVLVNGSFANRFLGWEPWEDREQGRPDVPGRLDILPGADAGAPPSVLRVARNSQRDAHNEPGLRQRLDRDVSGARDVRIEAKVRVEFASLSGGGYLGSEYPMMIRIRFRDALGGDRVWTQGFYYDNSENRPVPVGQQIEQGVWTPVAADLTRPSGQFAAIEAIEVFGAGHTFDASIGEIRLLVD